MKDELHKLLTLTNISGIYIIDDALSVKEQDKFPFFWSMIETMRRNGKIEDINNIDDDQNFDFENNEPVLNKYSKDIWEQSAGNPEKRLHYLRYLCDKTDNQHVKTILSVEKVVEDLDLGADGIEVRGLSPEEWEAQSTTLISSVPDGKRLIVLFDQVLDLATGRFATMLGIDLLKRELEKGSVDKLVLGLLTYKVERESDELKVRSDLAVQHEIASQDIFVLTKKRLEELSHFVEGIKKVLLNGPVEKIRDHTIRVGEEAFKATCDKIRLIDTFDFEQVVLNSSLKEGVWAPDTLLRILDIVYKDEIRNSVSKNDGISTLNSLVQKASYLSEVKIRVDKPEEYPEKYALRRLEMYADGNQSNYLFKPIENGDIFEVCSSGASVNGWYILLAQPCDLVVRSSGDKVGSRNADTAHLLKVDVLTKAELSSKLTQAVERAKNKPHDSNIWPTHGILEYLDADHDKIGLVKFPRACIANMNVIDLIMFNASGEAVLDATNGKPQASALHVGLEKRFDKVFNLHINTMKKIVDHTAYLETVKGKWPKQVIDSILDGLKIKLALNDEKVVKAKVVDKKVSYSIRRVQTLRDPYAKNLLDRYAGFLSRVGNLHDFAE